MSAKQWLKMHGCLFLSVKTPVLKNNLLKILLEQIDSYAKFMIEQATAVKQYFDLNVFLTVVKGLRPRNYSCSCLMSH